MNRIPRDERDVRDEDVFEALDLDRRGLGTVRRSYEAGALTEAKGALVGYFRTRKRPRWFFDFRDQLRGRVPSSWNGYDAGSLRRADALLKNRFSLTGNQPWDFGDSLNWRTQEMQGLGSAPSSLKRGNFFRDLATAYAQTGRPIYAAKFAELMDRWMLDWPLVVDEDFGPRDAVLSRPDGHKAMPTAQRVIAWLDCLYGGVVFAPEVPVETAFGLIRTVWFTALQYRRYETSPYVQANHHLWERGAAPFLFGIALPEFPEVGRLADQGRPVIAEHVSHSFLSDGGYEERATAYTISPLQMFLVPLRLAELNRMPLFTRGEKIRVRRCVENLAQMTLPTGTPPDIGDGRHGSPQRIARLLGMSTDLLKSPVCAECVKRLGLTRFADPEDRKALAASKRVNLPLTVHYPVSGYFVARDGWSRRSSAMALSVPGPGLPNHAHDDALSIQLVVRGESIVGTPTSELYSFIQQDRYRKRKALIRGHFHAMTSHNVVLVRGEPLHSVCELADDWRVAPTPVQTRYREDEGGVWAISSHTGYPGVKLSREVDFRHKKKWTVVDRVKGEVGKAHVVRWHFEYGVGVEEAGDGFVATGEKARLGIWVQGEGKVRTRLYRDNKWLGKNPLRPGEAAPWVLDVRFGSTGDDALETRFEILKGSR